MPGAIDPNKTATGSRFQLPSTNQKPQAAADVRMSPIIAGAPSNNGGAAENGAVVKIEMRNDAQGGLSKFSIQQIPSDSKTDLVREHSTKTQSDFAPSMKLVATPGSDKTPTTRSASELAVSAGRVDDVTQPVEANSLLQNSKPSLPTPVVIDGPSPRLATPAPPTLIADATRSDLPVASAELPPMPTPPIGVPPKFSPNPSPLNSSDESISKRSVLDTSTTRETSRSPQVVRIPSMTVGTQPREQATNKNVSNESLAVQRGLSIERESNLAGIETFDPARTPKNETQNKESPEVGLSENTPHLAAERVKEPSPMKLPPAAVLHSEKTENKHQLMASAKQFDAPKAVYESTIAAHEPPVPQMFNAPMPTRTAQPIERTGPTVVALPVANLPSTTRLLKSASAIHDAPMRLTDTKSNSYGGNQDYQSHANRRMVEIIQRSAETVDIGRPIAQIEIGDESICKVLATESTTLIIFGLEKGSTTVTLWPYSTDGVGLPERFEITVRDAWSSDSNDSRNSNSIAEAEQSLTQMFPNAQLKLKAYPSGGLVILGRASSNEEAKQIALLVRKMFLVPVLDRVAVATP
jgi:hypothetical protein